MKVTRKYAANQENQQSLPNAIRRTVGDLWENLEAALVSQQESIPADTEQQVRDAWSRRGPNDEVWLAPWMWVLDNEIPENFQGQWHDLFEAALQAQAHPRR